MHANLATSASIDTRPRPGASCPICDGAEFKDHKSRGYLRCATCGSFPRTRSAWLLIQHVAKLRPDARIAHFAPERTLARLLMERYGAGYEAYDLNPRRWADQAIDVRQFDLCTDLHRLQDRAYDLVMHHHVMEHVPCNETVVMQRLQAKVRVGGYHIFSFPIQKGGHYRSDIDPGLSGDERLVRFGQNDHLRRFGELDFDRTIGMVFDIPATYNLTRLLGEEILTAAHVLPPQRSIGGGAVFILDSDGKVPAAVEPRS